MHLALVNITLDWKGSLTELIPQIHAHLQTYGTPVRWAITAVQDRTLTLEAVVVTSQLPQ
ncbi:MAG: hypothetical protein Q6L50_01765 [Gloeomargarita sp. GMQP_bins_120]